MYRDHEQEVEGGIDDLVIVRWTGHALEAMDFMGPVSRVDVIVRYRISSTENEGGLARLPVWQPLGALEGGLTGWLFREFFDSWWPLLKSRFLSLRSNPVFRP